MFEVQQQSNEKIQYEIRVIVDLYNQNDQDILLHLDDMYHIDVYHHKHPREKQWFRKSKKKQNLITNLGSSTPNGAGVRAASCEYKFLLTTWICASFCISSEEKGANWIWFLYIIKLLTYV